MRNVADWAERRCDWLGCVALPVCRVVLRGCERKARLLSAVGWHHARCFPSNRQLSPTLIAPV